MKKTPDTADARKRTKSLRLLAIDLAGCAEAICASIVEASNQPWWSTTLNRARRNLRDFLEADDTQPLTDAEFADACAQAIVFRWLIARVGCHADDCIGGSAEFKARQATAASESEAFATMLGALDDIPPLAATCRRSLRRVASWDVNAALSDIGERTGAAAVIGHVHELFLATYKRQERHARGVFYTPSPVISYLLDSVEHLLQTRFGVPGGFASSVEANGHPRVHVVDPACGTGAFLAAFAERTGTRGDANRKLTGFELLPASCAIGRMLLAKHTTAVSPHGPTIHWLDSLSADPARVAHCLQWDGIDRQRSPLVVVGNPPYSNFGRHNRGVWIHRLLRDYKDGLEEKKSNLNDDFIKFIRWGQYWIDRAGAGILAFVTNNTYLDGLTQRRMRQSLANSFDEIFILDLHGSAGKREVAPDGSRDENVFDIRPGVAIGVFLKSGSARGDAQVWHAELFGSRQRKFATLSSSDVSTTTWRPVPANDPLRRFVPARHAHGDEYHSWPSLPEIFQRHISGVQTKNDRQFVAMSPAELNAKMQAFFAQSAAAPDAQDRGVSFCRDKICSYMVAPFDQRWVYYDPRLLGRARQSVMQHMLADNVGLVFMRQSTNQGAYDHVLATNGLVSDRVFYSVHGAPFLAPLFCNDGAPVPASRHSNLDASFAGEFVQRLGLRYAGARSDGTNAVGCRELFWYLYAVLHNPSFRQRYADELKVDFPRIPWTSDRALFRRLCQLGARLTNLHLMQWPLAEAWRKRFPASGTNLVERRFPRFVNAGETTRIGNYTLSAGSDHGRVFINPRQYIDRVSAVEWDYHVGGYRPLQRWLAQRRDRPLDEDQLRRVLSIARVARLTHRLSSAIERAVQFASTKDSDPSGPVRAIR